MNEKLCRRSGKNYVPLVDSACSGQVVINGVAKVCEVNCLAVAKLRSRRKEELEKAELLFNEAGDNLPCLESGLDLAEMVKTRKSEVNTPDISSQI